MTAGRYHIKIEKGADLLLTIDVKDSSSSAENFTGYGTVRSKFKNYISDSSAVLEANNSNSRLTFSDTTGRIDFNVPASVTSNLNEGEGVYDLEVVSGTGQVYRILEGTYEISPEVTD